MSFRAVILGVMLGLAVAGLTYFNDAVAHSTFLIGNQFPIGVFGILMLLLLGVNPLLGRLKTCWRLRGRELAVITALGLAVCGWPGSGFFRIFSPDMAMPAKLISTKPAWQAAHVMSYVPGGSALLGQGHLMDCPGLARRLIPADGAEARPVDRMVWKRFSKTAREVLREAVRTNQVTDSDRHFLLSSLNQIIRSPGFYESFAREELPEDAKAVLAERDELIRYGKQLDAERVELTGRLQQRRADQEPRLQELAGKRTPLLVRRKELAGSRDELTNKVDDFRERLTTLGEKEGDHDVEIRSLKEQIGGLREEVSRLGREIGDLDRELKPLDAHLERLEKEIDRFDNKIRRLDRELASVRRRVGIPDEAGRFQEKVNRILLVSFYPEEIAPAPAGGGVLLTGGDADPFAVDTLNQGWDGPEPLGVTELPWKLWWPTLRLWGTVAILVAIAVLCVAVIVHPQWSQRELLAYPIARFVEEATQTEGDSNVPTVLRSKLFWYGFGALIVLHLVNGLHTWFPDKMFFEIPMTLDFRAMGELMPNAMRIARAPNLRPTIYLSVVAFAFFLNMDVSFSLGMAPFAWGALGAFCFSRGIAAEQNPQLNLLLFGASFGIAVMVLYMGRRYYLNVAASVVGFKRRSDTPSYATWAARVMVVCLVVAVFVLDRAGLDWPFGILVVTLVLIIGLVAARANAESGLFFLHMGWGGWGLAVVLLAFLGVEAISPQVLVMLGLVSIVLVGDPRETFMPYLVNGLRMVTGTRTDRDETVRTPMRRVAPLLGMMIVLGFLVALVATFYLQYNRGFNYLDNWAVRSNPATVFNFLSSHVSKLSAQGRLVEATNYKGADWIKALAPNRKLLVWAGLGFALVMGCSVGRLRFSWWFVHPIMFIFWGGYARTVFAASFLIGWLVKVSIVKLGGARSYKSVKPLMIGIIAGELVAGLCWILVAAIYWVLVKQSPVQYRITPG